MDNTSGGEVTREISHAAASRLAHPPPPPPIVPRKQPMSSQAASSTLPSSTSRPPLPPRASHLPMRAIPGRALIRRPPPRPPSPPPSRQATTFSAQTQQVVPPSDTHTIVTLDQARYPRAVNEYIEQPLPVSQPKNNLRLNRIHGNHHLLTPTVLTTPIDRLAERQPQTTITDQPVSSVLKKQSDQNQTNDPEICESHGGESGIYCKMCGKCKCGACTQPRDCCKPRWICDKECSLSKMVDYVSCLCCVQCMLYHFRDNEDDEFSDQDDPCACLERPHCFKRWTCMAAMSICLPCLLLYWPLQCTVGGCTACYHRCFRRGCQCRRDNNNRHNTFLLLESESSSA